MPRTWMSPMVVRPMMWFSLPTIFTIVNAKSSLAAAAAWLAPGIAEHTARRVYQEMMPCSSHLN